MKGVKACLRVKAPKGEGALAKSFEVREGDRRVGAEAQPPQYWEALRFFRRLHNEERLTFILT